ncbi:MAG: hypothetical protein HYX60_02295 [Legionella longbeachae]|nr:hypothetical protein [Legionella longbeachae]
MNKTMIILGIISSTLGLQACTTVESVNSPGYRPGYKTNVYSSTYATTPRYNRNYYGVGYHNDTAGVGFHKGTTGHYKGHTNYPKGPTSYQNPGAYQKTTTGNSKPTSNSNHMKNMY